jgi:aminomethyltransferase
MPNNTSLTSLHEENHAVMAIFADTWLPLKFSSEKSEHLAVRNAVGLFDVSHMGEFTVTGLGALNFLQKTLTNNAALLAVGKAQYSLLLNHQAGIIDDLIVYCLAPQSYFLCVNAANIAVDWQWLSAQVESFADVKLENVSPLYAQIAVQGPKALSLIATLSKDSLPERFGVKAMTMVLGSESIKVLVAFTGYTGEDGVEIFVAPKDASLLWRALLKEGEPFGVQPCGLAARDSLRVEAGFSLHGHEIDEQTTPKEAGLMFAVDMTKPHFIGREALAAQIAAGIKKRLVGLRLQERGVPRAGFLVADRENKVVGHITSSAWPPGHEHAIAMAYVDNKIPKGATVMVTIRERPVPAQVVSTRELF